MQIDFHILNITQQKAWLFMCSMAEKIYTEKKFLYIHTNSRADAEKLDAFLWTYREDSFLPHQLFSPQTEDIPVQIGYEDSAPLHGEILINLSSVIPKNYQQFKQLIEIVFADAEIQQLARHRYKHYRDAGFDIQTYKSISS